MLRLNKMTDYGLVLLTHFAECGDAFNAKDLSARSHIPLPTVSKLLKMLSKVNLLESRRGPSGGYRLTRRPERISVAEVVAALEGHLGMTECTSQYGEICRLEPVCPVKANWKRINEVVTGALRKLTLAQLSRPLPRSWSD